jgi:hypothetical protein
VIVRAGPHDLAVLVDRDFTDPRVDVALAFDKWSRQGVTKPDERCRALREWLASDEVADPRFLGVSHGRPGRTGRLTVDRR